MVDDGFVPSDVKKVIVGPCNDRPGATKLGNNQSITQEEAEALEAIYQAGYEIEFALIKKLLSEAGVNSEDSSVSIKIKIVYPQSQLRKDSVST